MVAGSWRLGQKVVSDDPVPLCTAVVRVVERTAHVSHVADACVLVLCACAKLHGQNPVAENREEVPSSNTRKK